MSDTQDTTSRKTSVHCQNPDCKKQYKISVKHAGKEVPCPSCGWKIHVPIPTSVPTEQEEQEMKRLAQDLGAYTTGHKALKHVLEHAEGGQAKTYAVQIAGLAAAVVAIAVVIYLGIEWFTPPTPPPPPSPPAPRNVQIAVTPFDVRIVMRIDGEPVTVDTALEGAEHRVTVIIKDKESREIEIKADGYHPERRRLDYHTVTPVRIALKPVIKQLEVTSEPPGANVFLDDSPSGRTPARLGVKMIAETVTLRVELTGYRPTQRVLSTADALSEVIQFDLVPTLAALAQHNWIEFLRSNRMADRAAAYGRPAIQSIEPWSQERSPDTDFVIGIGGNRIAVTFTTQTISLATALGSLTLGREAIAWADMLDESRLVVRTNLGDTLVGELVDTNIAYETAPGTAGKVKGDQVQALVFRSTPPRPRSDTLTTVALAIGAITCLGTDLQGAITLKTGLGDTVIDGTNIRSLRRLDDPEDQFRIDAKDGSLVSGSWAAGSLSIKLLCNDARVKIDARQLKAIEVTPSVQAAAKVTQREAMTQSLAMAEAEVDQLDQEVKAIENENRALVKQRKERADVLRAQRRDARKRKRQSEKAELDRAIGIPNRSPSVSRSYSINTRLIISKDSRVKKIDALLDKNRKRLTEAKKARLTARKKVLQIKKDIEAIAATVSGDGS